ncbi:phosphoinositide 3-kinase regulatory subunit 5 isoform X2 [Bufo gargarizans]|uniref:phosphoinositide 3-kinase regulatory subunit 5 isoform X2 n=1 Tax=Bufo gargarizans TaxID=30331 RepID=UPI001CF57076|nr:phosphoinositide 3-kinase regulatory subunit 5 isoform X2 [Bufo gargarizans]
MQNTSCTEDRIQHALERCLHGLSRTPGSSSSWTAGLCLNYWSLAELVNREAANHIILAEKILERTREAQEKCEYELLTPLALMFHFAVLLAPWIPEECSLLSKAFETFHVFLTWPAPYCDIYQEILSFISEEQKVPGITYQRLVRAEQGLSTKSPLPSIVTVLLVNPLELPKEFLSVVDNLSNTEQTVQNTYISLIEHLYQANLGPSPQITDIKEKLKSKTVEELETVVADLTETVEQAANDSDIGKNREWLKAKLQEIGKQADFLGDKTGISAGQFQPIYLPVPKCYTYTWDQDNFDVLNNILLPKEDTRATSLSPEYEVNEEDNEDGEEEEEEEEELEEVEEEINDNNTKRDSVFSSNSRRYVYWSMPSDVQEKANMANISNHSMQFVSNLSSCVDSGYIEDSDDSSQETPERIDYREEKVNRKFTQKIRKLFTPKNHLSKGKSKTDLSNSPTHSLTGSMSSLQNIPLRRAGSLCTPQVRRVPVRSKRSQSLPQHALGAHIWEVQQNQKLALKRRPFLSSNEDSKASTLRVVVFGSDRISGKLARAYSNLRLKESKCPLLTRFFKLQLYYVPVRRNSLSPTVTLTNPDSPLKSPSPSGKNAPEDMTGTEESTNDISHYIGMLDPWYKRNILGLMDLSTSVLSQSSTPENGLAETQKLPILSDMVLYYCRFANRSLLLQLYQAEITFDGGRKQTEVFIQSLEMGHSAALRAIKASGPGCKRLGIDGDREAIPFTLQIVYSKPRISGRSRWSDGEKLCTSVSLIKACKTLEELDAKMECLNLTVREVVKRQNSKTKKSFNQISISQIKVDKAQIIAQNGGTFPLCLDQDERKILQRVVKCEVSPCYKPEVRDFRSVYNSHWSQTSQDQFCSLLCLPIATFSGAQL